MQPIDLYGHAYSDCAGWTVAHMYIVLRIWISTITQQHAHHVRGLRKYGCLQRRLIPSMKFIWIAPLQMQNIMQVLMRCVQGFVESVWQ